MMRLTLLAAIALACAAPAAWAQQKPWQEYRDCRYVQHPSNDGDSFRARCGREEIFVRLYFVDAPETDLSYPERTRQQSQYFGVSVDDTLRTGAHARDYVQNALRQPFTVLTRRTVAPGRSATTRYYAVVRVNGHALEALLLREGLARNKGFVTGLHDGTRSKAWVQSLQRLEDEARLWRRGVWARSSRI